MSGKTTKVGRRGRARGGGGCGWDNDFLMNADCKNGIWVPIVEYQDSRSNGEVVSLAATPLVRLIEGPVCGSSVVMDRFMESTESVESCTGTLAGWHAFGFALNCRCVDCTSLPMRCTERG